MIKKKNTIVIILFIFGLGLTILISFLNNDRIGIMENINPDTGLKETYEYLIRNGDTVLNGRFADYNKSGIKIAEGNYINNEIVGIYTHYYDDGTIQTQQFKENSKKTIEGIWYNPKGQVETYTMYDEYGKPCFLMKHMDKKVVLYKGYPLLEIYQYKIRHKEKFNIKTEQYLKIGDKLKYSYLIANIPNAIRSLKIENLNVDNSKVTRTLKHVKPCQWHVEEILTKKGKNTIRSIVKYEFKDKITPVLTDTVSFDVIVN